MNVKNRKCIRKLSLKSLYANRRRNLIAIFAIALTTLLFTSMFTIVLSLNASYETYQFRQVGGYAHGTFKDVSPRAGGTHRCTPKGEGYGGTEGNRYHCGGGLCQNTGRDQLHGCQLH